MVKKPKSGPPLPVNEQGQPVDPFTGELLVPINELEAAIERIGDFKIPDISKPNNIVAGGDLALLLGVAPSTGKSIIASIGKQLREKSCATIAGIPIPNEAFGGYGHLGRIAHGITTEYATKIVDRYAQLKQIGTAESNTKKNNLPEGWHTAKGLWRSKKYEGKVNTFKRHFSKYAHNKLQELQVAGKTHSDAVEELQSKWVGNYQFVATILLLVALRH